MAKMEFLTPNLLNTTTQLKVDSATNLSSYLFDRNLTLGYTSSGYNSTTSTVISIEFSSPTVISHVLLQNHNLRAFRLFYDSATANSLVPTVTTNSATSSYYSFSSVTVSSVQIQMDNTIAGSAEKSIGEFVVGERTVQFERNPSVEKWKPVVFRKQVMHEMPDGGTVLFNIKDKYQAKLSWKFITSSFRDQIFSVYTAADPIYFLPFPTTTAWDGAAYESAWVGNFDFMHSTNDKAQGFTGSILLKETPSR